MSPNDVARVHYFAKQFLRMGDFTDEQAYHLAMRRRHLIAQHSWGIVRGLELGVEEGNLFVQPGLAVDGYGRELILEDKQLLSTTAFVEQGSATLNVWMEYKRLGTEQAPAGYDGCGTEAEGDFYRWQETPLIRLDVPDPEFPDPRQPQTVPPGDLNFNPSRTPPDDPGQDWPVFLGQILFNPANTAQPYGVDLSNRPYVGLIGETVTAPSGQALVRLAPETPNDPPGFAVFILNDQNTELEPRLEIDPQGETTVTGDATLHGNLNMAQGAIEFGMAPDVTHKPWRIYHHQEDTDHHELRLVLPQGTKGNNQVVIGHWDTDNRAFVPCLTIADTCTVTVHGNLVVEGQIRSGAIVPVPLSVESKRFMLSTLMSGISGSNVLLGQFYHPNRALEALRILSPQVRMEVIAEHLTSLTAEELRNLVKTRSGLAERLRRVLKKV